MFVPKKVMSMKKLKFSRDYSKLHLIDKSHVYKSFSDKRNLNSAFLWSFFYEDGVSFETAFLGKRDYTKKEYRILLEVLAYAKK